MDKEKYSKICALALNTVFGFKPRFSHSIIDALGSAEAIFKLPQKELTRIFGPYCSYLEQINGRTLENAEKEYDRIVSEGCQIVSIYDDGYPALLRDCPDAPLALYIKSPSPAEELFSAGPYISIIGTRDISLYGREWCRRIVETLSQSPTKPTIVSGMAIGVDITAHMAALDCGLPTIGVLPVGIDGIYPLRHRPHGERISSTRSCALISDFPAGTAPVAFNFLRRNRIIAGMSQATILVESKARGGGMMTARLASGYGRELAVLPGRIDDARSQGCNQLIREKIAEPIVSLETLPAQLGLGTYRLGRKASLAEAVRGRLSGKSLPDEVESAVRLALAVKSSRGISYDELCESLCMDYPDICRLVSLLENEGILETDLLQRCCINTKFK